MQDTPVFSIMKEHLDFRPLKDHPELVSESVYACNALPDEILVGKIDPQYMNGTALSDHYDVALEDGANCIVVRGKKGELRMMAAVLVPVGFRADLNGLVCEMLGAKKVSMAPLEEVIAETGMEYGSITPVGLPDSWKILIDSRLMQKEEIIMGAGKQMAKLKVKASYLKRMPNVLIVEGLAHAL